MFLGGIEPVLRGVIGSAASAVSADMLLADEVTERLVVLDTLKQMDLAALNLQRGRDHGLPGKILAESQICHSNVIRLSSSNQSNNNHSTPCLKKQKNTSFVLPFVNKLCFLVTIDKPLTYLMGGH